MQFLFDVKCYGPQYFCIILEKKYGTVCNVNESFTYSDVRTLKLITDINASLNSLTLGDIRTDDLARAYQTPLVPGEPEPDWVARERAQFREHRDLDKNGKMDRHEVGEWIMPSGYDPVEAEAQHLFYHADRDRVGLVQMYNYYF